MCCTFQIFRHLHNHKLHLQQPSDFYPEGKHVMNPILYIHGSVHRNSVLIISNKMQQYTGIYLLQSHSTCFGCPSYPSSGVHKNCNCSSWYRYCSICARNFLQRGQIWPRCRNVVAVPEAAVTVFYELLMMGAMDTRNMYGRFAVNKYLYTVASCWILLVHLMNPYKGSKYSQYFIDATDRQAESILPYSPTQA